MTVMPTSTDVKRIVARFFSAFGVAEAAAADPAEVGLACGDTSNRSYRAGGFLAMWLIEDGLLQFYDRRGNLLLSLNLLEELQPARLAA